MILERSEIPKYVIIFVCILLFTTRIFQPTFHQLLGIIVGLCVIYYLQLDTQKNVSTFNQILEHKLYTLKKITKNDLKYLHINADLIEIFYNIRELKYYNPKAYDNSLIMSNNIQNIISDAQVGLEECEHNYDIASDLMNQIMNQMHTLIYRLPVQNSENSLMNKRHDKVLESLQLVLRRDIDILYKICKNNKKDINIHTRIRHNKGPRPQDHSLNPNYDVYY